MVEQVGGGAKKVLYTLNTVRQIGLKNSAKALKAKNACKACGLGMGGQLGGMVNEKGEFPSICNKSVQAQSTDIQQPIPSEVFQHAISELRELSAKELEHIGRLGFPIYKSKTSNTYSEVSWKWAFQFAANKLKQSDPKRSFFYASGRSSNETGFLLQLFARLYGTNNITNCSYYCHQATGVGLASTIGTGTATVELDDLAGCDLVFLIGENPSSNHPRLIHQLKNCRERGGDVVVINPAKEPGLVKFAVPKSPKSMIVGGSHIASAYLQPNIGSDIAVIKGIAKVVIEAGQIDKRFIEEHCDNFQAFKRDIDATPWADIERTSGLGKAEIEAVGDLYIHSKNAIFAWGMGVTHHQSGCANVEYIANLALLRGMIGKPCAGLLPLRGHSNVQGIGTIGVKPVLPDQVINNLQETLGVSLPEEEGLDTLASIEAAHNGDMDTAVVVGGNLYSATPNSHWAKEALDNIGFKLFLTTTLNQGHLYGVEGDVLILPVTARDEETQSTTQESMFNYVRLSDGGIERLQNVKSEVSIISELAQRVLPESPVDFSRYGDHETIRESIAKTIPGMEGLKDISVAKEEFHVGRRILHTPEFNTENGRARFIVHPIPDNYDTAERPFMLATIRSEGQFNSIIYEETDSYRHDADRQTVFIAKKDMQTLQLKTGDKVDIVSSIGAMEDVSVQAFDIPPGNLLAYYPEANVLTECNVDPRSKTPNFKSIRVSLKKHDTQHDASGSHVR